MGSPDKSTIMDRYPPSGLSILIVGGGIGGLTFAIEAYRKGHEVRVLEKRPSFEGYGELASDAYSTLPCLTVLS
jgi:2-polyprenyl-6-methoxyphenol hydroxylase-like FAD-dependent oxidoreductase